MEDGGRLSPTYAHLQNGLVLALTEHLLSIRQFSTTNGHRIVTAQSDPKMGDERVGCEDLEERRHGQVRIVLG